MKLTDYRTLGKSGLRISPITLGTMTFGEDWGWGASINDAEKILAKYIELGGNSIDTADIYTKGHSEKIIGDFLKKSSFRREQLVIGTKFFGNLHPGDPNGGGTSRKTILQSIEHSLRRLQTDYIDIYWMHAFDEHTPIEETLSTLDDLVASGKIRYIAVSDTPAWKIAQAQMFSNFRGWKSFIGLQLEYSLLERTVEGELIPMAKDLGLGVMPWSPLKEGLLSGKYTRDNKGQIQSGRTETRIDSKLFSESTYQIIDRLNQLAKDKQTTVASVALSWVINRTGVTSTIVGVRTLQQLEQNLNALAINLTKEDIQSLDELSEPVLNFPISMLRSGIWNLAQAGTTVNEITSIIPPILPKNESEIY